MTTMSKSKTIALLTAALPAFVQLVNQFPQVFRTLTTDNVDYIINDTFQAGETAAPTRQVARAVNAYIADVILQGGNDLFDDIDNHVLPLRLSVAIGKLDNITHEYLQTASYQRGTPFAHNYTRIVLTLDEDFAPSVEVSFIKQ